MTVFIVFVNVIIENDGKVSGVGDLKVEEKRELVI